MNTSHTNKTIGTRTLGTVNGGLTVSNIGLGCMGMSEFYGARDDAQSMQTLNRAVDLGVTFLDSAETYGLGHNEELIGRLIAERGRDAITIATKFGIRREPGAYARGISNDPAYLRQACENSLKRLGTDYIDLYYIHRIETNRPIEEPMQELSKLVAEGKIGHIGICEASSDTLRKAHAVHAITALQTEYSLWTREAENDVFAVCKELDIGFVPYSPLGRGFLTGAMNTTDELAENDFRRANPRFQKDALEKNMVIVSVLQTMAKDKACSPAQLALAWVLKKGETIGIDIAPIPGTKRSSYLEENVGALSVALAKDELDQLDRLIPIGVAVGDRYTAEGMKGVNA